MSERTIAAPSTRSVAEGGWLYCRRGAASVLRMSSIKLIAGSASGLALIGPPPLFSDAHQDSERFGWAHRQEQRWHWPCILTIPGRSGPRLLSCYLSHAFCPHSFSSQYPQDPLRSK